jgi:hypothetical protein
VLLGPRPRSVMSKPVVVSGPDLTHQAAKSSTVTLPAANPNPPGEKVAVIVS